ncbi:unnamed protein product [Darwinula stevensoni]|uniref:Uncharacterized protein n=1 Tax=Darwinula stevensoni TaxID=69355 RepID=A0A7R8X449_9CRUS|nr:unnamed protein product [Darwinula stevensoni]CAG0885053.1 unnamed protein product [Darwinula stevensoni]
MTETLPRLGVETEVGRVRAKNLASETGDEGPRRKKRIRGQVTRRPRKVPSPTMTVSKLDVTGRPRWINGNEKETITLPYIRVNMPTDRKSELNRFKRSYYEGLRRLPMAKRRIRPPTAASAAWNHPPSSFRQYLAPVPILLSRPASDPTFPNRLVTAPSLPEDPVTAPSLL